MTVFVNGLVMLYRARLNPDRQQRDSQATSHTPTPPPFPASLPMPMPNFQPYHAPPYGSYGYLPPNQAQQMLPHLSWHPSDGELDNMPRQRRRLDSSGLSHDEPLSTALVRT